MSKVRKFAAVLLILLFAMALFSACDNNKKTAESMQVGENIYVLDGVEQDFDNAFFDDFTNGVNPDYWYIGKQAWGANGNGGVIPENVNFTDDGILVLSGNGSYYTAGDVSGVGTIKDGSLTGAAIISKFVTGPGRYQVKMKVLPRKGACSAFWTYCYDTETLGNHEIDIEIPGGKEHSQVISFQNVLNTNYITVEYNESKDVDLKEVFDDSSFALNDGEWHTFGFDWYTNPKMVVYYIDGKVTAISSDGGTFVPYYAARLWLGVWFPNSTGFVGDALFESDYMYVDWVKYIPFKDQEYTMYNPAISSAQVASLDEYPTLPVSTASVNKVANGDFEYILKNPDANSGWKLQKRWLEAAEKTKFRQEVEAQIREENPLLTDDEVAAEVKLRLKQYEENTAVSEFCRADRQLGKDLSCGAEITDIGIFHQVIDSVYEGFEFDFSVAAKGKGKVQIMYYSYTGMLSQETIDIDCSDWQTFTCKLTAPKDCYHIFIYVTTEYGHTLCFDDMEMRMV